MVVLDGGMESPESNDGDEKSYQSERAFAASALTRPEGNFLRPRQICVTYRKILDCHREHTWEPRGFQTPFNLPHLLFRYPPPRLLPRIPRRRGWRCAGNIGLGRVAIEQAAPFSNWWKGHSADGPRAVAERSTSSPQSADHKNSFPTTRTYTQTSLAGAPLDRRRRIHIIGTGSIGKFIAHALRSIANPPPITLIFHRWGLMNEWQESSKQIRLTTQGVSESRGGFDVDIAIPKLRKYGEEREPMDDHWTPEKAGFNPSDEHISSLIVTVKAFKTVSALSSVKHRLTRDSTILFLQNGMGIIDEVNREVFPDPETRPSYMLGIITHGVSNQPAEDSFGAIHHGFGTISLGLLPRSPSDVSLTSSAIRTTFSDETWSRTSHYLLRALTRTPVLCAVGFSPTELLQVQLEKLAIHSVLYPLTVLIDARNGAILHNYSFSRVQRLLISEISLVIRSLPEVANLPNVENRFGPERLETLLVGLANKTSEGLSGMLVDARKGWQTEIEYMNGYIVKRGEEMGFKPVMNYLIMHLVKGKALMIHQEMTDFLPFLHQGRREEYVREGGKYKRDPDQDN